MTRAELADAEQYAATDFLVDVTTGERDRRRSPGAARGWRS